MICLFSFFGYTKSSAILKISKPGKRKLLKDPFSTILLLLVVSLHSFTPQTKQSKKPLHHRHHWHIHLVPNKGWGNEQERKSVVQPITIEEEFHYKIKEKG